MLYICPDCLSARPQTSHDRDYSPHAPISDMTTSRYRAQAVYCLDAPSGNAVATVASINGPAWIDVTVSAFRKVEVFLGRAAVRCYHRVRKSAREEIGNRCAMPRGSKQLQMGSSPTGSGSSCQIMVPSTASARLVDSSLR
jgi:hypothetical protein